MSSTYEFAGGSSPNNDNNDNDQEDGNADTKADPLLFACGACTHDRTVNLHVALLQVLVCIHGLCLDVLHHRLLLHDDSVQILEQLLQLEHSLLDLLNGGVTLADVRERTLSLTATIRVHERLLEDLGIRAFACSFLDLLLCRIGPDNEELSALLFLNILPELALNLLVRVDGLANAAVQGVDLGLVPRVLGVVARLDALHAVGKSAVAAHDICAEGIDFFARVARRGDELTLATLEGGKTGLEVVDRATDGAAVVEDGIGVCRVLLVCVRVVGLAHVLHFDGLLACGRVRTCTQCSEKG
jgi:hypothetical protein